MECDANFSLPKICSGKLLTVKIPESVFHLLDMGEAEGVGELYLPALSVINSLRNKTASIVNAKSQEKKIAVSYESFIKMKRVRKSINFMVDVSYM
jgi:hypothetical protein